MSDRKGGMEIIGGKELSGRWEEKKGKKGNETNMFLKEWGGLTVTEIVIILV